MSVELGESETEKVSMCTHQFFFFSQTTASSVSRKEFRLQQASSFSFGWRLGNLNLVY